MFSFKPAPVMPVNMADADKPAMELPRSAR
jgi:hypothetical protein